MASQEHLDLLKQGVDIWNQWRTEHPMVSPDLGVADLSEANFQEVNFSRTRLVKAHLCRTNLTMANFSFAACMA